MARNFVGRVSGMGKHDMAHISLDDQPKVRVKLHLSSLSELQYERGQHRLFRDFLLPRQPSASTFVSKEYFFDESTIQLPPIREELHRVMSARVSSVQ